VLIFDLGALSGGISECFRLLRSRLPNARILVLGESFSVDDLRRLLPVGVQGFVLYRDIDKSLARAVQVAWAGGLWVDGQELGRLVEGRPKGASKGAENASRMFTPREEVVVELLQLRLCNKEISARLGISEATVKFHLKNVFNKLGLHDRHAVADREANSRHLQLLAS